MEWDVRESIVSPDTGTGLLVAETARNLKLILWYRSNIHIKKGEVIIPTPFGMVVNGAIRNISILHAFPWNKDLWLRFQGGNDCPGNTSPEVSRCLRKVKCRFPRCPFGIIPDPS